MSDYQLLAQAIEDLMTESANPAMGEAFLYPNHDTALYEDQGIYIAITEQCAEQIAKISDLVNEARGMHNISLNIDSIPGIVCVAGYDLNIGLTQENIPGISEPRFFSTNMENALETRQDANDEKASIEENVTLKIDNKFAQFIVDTGEGEFSAIIKADVLPNAIKFAIRGDAKPKC